MASFDNTIRLITQLDDAGVKKLFKSLKSVETLVNKINSKPVQAFSFKGKNDFSAAVLKDAQTQLSKIDTAFTKVAVSADKAKNGFKNISVQAQLAKARYESFGKSLNSARVEVEKYNDILQNVDLSEKNSAEVKRLAKAWAEGTKAVSKYNEQLNDIKRKALGLQPQKQRDFEVARRKRLLKDRELERQSQQRILDIEKRRVREQERLAKAAERARKEAQRQEAAKKKARNDRIQGSLIGGSFPLLFGGPSFSAVGGALGGLAGGQAGFALGIALSAVGAAFDAAAEKASDLAGALRSPTENIQKLTDVLDIAGTSSDALIKDLQKLGANEIAASVATNELNKRLQDLGKNPETFKQRSKELENAFSRLKLALAALGVELLPLVKNLTSAVAALGGARGPGPTRTTQGAGNAVTGASRAAFNPETAFLNTKEQAALNQLLERRLKNERDILSVKEQELNADRLQRATLEGNLAIEQKTREFLTLQSRARFEQNAILKQQLKDEAEILNIQRKQLVVAKQNAELRAAQQIAFTSQDNTRAADLKAAQNSLALQQAVTLDKDFLGRQSGNRAVFGIDLTTLDTFKANIQAIKNLEEARLKQIDAQITQTERQYGLSVLERATRIDLLKQEKEGIQINTALQLRQLEADRARLKLAQMRFDQELKLSKLLGQQEVDRAGQASPLAQFDNFNLDNLFQGFGFFTETVNLADERLLQFNQRVAQLDQQLADLKEQRGIDQLAGADTTAIDNQIRKTETLLNNYREFQPQLDKIAVQQQAFNDAFAVTNPIMQDLVNNLAEVAKGTVSVTEAFANMLDSIGKMLAQKGAEMIAQYIAIGIARAFAGMGAPSSTPAPPATPNGTQVYGGQLINTGISAAANGGPAFTNRPMLVGERGPELFVPSGNGRIATNAESRAALDRYTPNSSYNYSSNLNITTGPVMQMNNDQYIKREDFERGLRQATADGAKRGEAMTLKRLKNSRSTRSTLGM